MSDQLDIAREALLGGWGQFMVGFVIFGYCFVRAYRKWSGIGLLWIALAIGGLAGLIHGVVIVTQKVLDNQ